ncbi:MAG TPA: hypothetical protein VGL09_02910, partial [Methylomirabilota bacterium]
MRRYRSVRGVRAASTAVSRRVLRLEALSRRCGLLVAVIAVLALVGWALDIDLLKRGVPGHVAVNPVTALAFLVAAGALWIHHRARRIHSAPGLTPPSMFPSTRSPLQHIVRTCAILILALGLVTVAGYVGGHNLGLDQLLLRAKLGGNRIAPNTGLSFVFIALALWLLARPSGPWRLTEQLVAVVPIGL